MPPKKGALDAAPEDDKEEIGEDTIFAGADEHEHDEEADTADRGDDPNAEQLAAEDETEDEAEAPAKAASEESEAEDTPAKAEAAVEDAEDEAEDEGEPEDDKVSNYVSKDRFNALNERMKLAEQALLDKEAELAKPEEEAAPAFDFDAKEMEYMEFVTDGEFEKAKTIRQEIRTAEREAIEADVASKTGNSAARVNEQIVFANKIEELSEEFDHFNTQHESYDQVLVDEAVDRRDLFIARGMSMADALDKAAREVAKLYDLPSNFEAAADAELERIAAEEKGKTPAAKKADVRKKVAQKAAQPPKMEEGSSQEEAPTSALGMTDGEFDALPESTKARMRGDIL